MGRKIKIGANLEENPSRMGVAARVPGLRFRGAPGLALFLPFATFAGQPPKFVIRCPRSGRDAAVRRCNFGMAVVVDQAGWPLADRPIRGPRKGTVFDWSVCTDPCGPRSSKEPERLLAPSPPPPWFWKRGCTVQRGSDNGP